MLSKKDLEKIRPLIVDTIKDTYDSKELERLRETQKTYQTQQELLNTIRKQFDIKVQPYVDGDTGQDYLNIVISTRYKNKCDLQTCDIELSNFIKSILLLDLLTDQAMDKLKEQIVKIREGRTYEN